MRHFANNSYHIATVATDDSSADFSHLTELPEGEDGKCAWCRSFDERRDEGVSS